jgi:thiamine kinase-like enzyme
LTPIHGDLSLDNIIINADGVHIIDWEHYTAAAAPWGFDIMYLLFVSLYFGMYLGKPQRHKPTGKEIRIICEHMKTINSHNHLSSDVLKAPLFSIREFILAHQYFWGSQFSSFQMKIPIIAFSTEQVTMIDEMIMAGLT